MEWPNYLRVHYAFGGDRLIELSEDLASTFSGITANRSERFLLTKIMNKTGFGAVNSYAVPQAPSYHIQSAPLSDSCQW